MGHRLSAGQYGFFDLFDRHASLALEGATVFAAAAEKWPAEPGAMNRIEEVEHECDSVAHMAIDLLHQSFITPLDRDEILQLICCLDDVIDLIESASRRIQIYELGALPQELREMAKTLHRAMEKVVELVRQLKDFKHTDRMRELFQEINQLENQGDTLMHTALGKIFTTHANDPLTVMKLKEVYEIVETAMDRCEDVANVVEGILLEHA